MGDLKSKLRARISRRHSGIPSVASGRTGNGSSASNHSIEPGSPTQSVRTRDAETPTAASAEQARSQPASQLQDAQSTDIKQAQGAKQHGLAGEGVNSGDANGGRNGRGEEARNPNSAEHDTNKPPLPASAAPGSSEGHGPNGNDRPPSIGKPSTTTKKATKPGRPSSSSSPANADTFASSDLPSPGPRPTVSVRPPSTPQGSLDLNSISGHLRASSSASLRPTGPPRRQSLLPNRQTTLIRTLLDAGQPDDLDHSAADQLLPISANMVTRKLWVKRPGASATLVTISEEDLVDDVRELILRKYANSLGRYFDAPDLTMRIVPREGQRQERVLGPEEPMARTLDAYFPGGQTVEEALLIDIPVRRTPRASPRNGPPHAQHLTSVDYEDIRPLEASTDYFGPGAVAHVPVTIAGAPNGTTHAISVLNTGQVPQIPSPGGTIRTTRQYRERPDRPRLGRQHTSSPTILNVVGASGHTATIAVATNHGMQYAPSNPRSRTHSDATPEQPTSGQAPPPAPPLPTPPTQESAAVPVPRSATPPPRTASPRPPPAARPKKKKTADAHPSLPAGMLNGGVPPINVLIVEDNIINLRLLEAFIKRLKVRWQTAMNGREAVTKWRQGGFHLVLMDIQLPVMSGLEATREIRRLERTNSIGAFSTANNTTNNTNGGEADESKIEIPEEDKLQNRELFKSPVIIVALTASSLQSDRHEALAAGCNDFLTKPVTYVWLERKVMEWGCMQALIDYDGWRKWKSFSQKPEVEEAPAKKAKAKKNRIGPNSSSSDNHQ